MTSVNLPVAALLGAVVWLGAGACRDRSVEREHKVIAAPPLRLAHSAAAAPTPAQPERSLGRGPSIHYPRSIPLRLAADVAVLDPPMRVVKIRAIPGGDLAVASGLAAGAWVLELVDLDAGIIRWRAHHCHGPAVHATAEHIVCAGAVGIDALAVASGARVWSTSLQFAAADGERLFARAPDGEGPGYLVDVASGAAVTVVTPPQDESFAEVARLCASEGEADLYSWSAAGRFSRTHITTAAPARAELVWARGLGRPPTKVDVCDPVVLVETPIPGSSLRTLRALSAESGAEVGEAIKAQGWWSARAGAGIETATSAGIAWRGRDLALVKTITADRIGIRSVDEWRGDRLLRGPAGTLVVLRADESLLWLAAPAIVGDAVITGDRLLAGPWLSPPQSSADYLALYQLPAAASASRQVPIWPPRPQPAGAVDVQPLGPLHPAHDRAVVVASDVGAHAVSHVTMAGSELFMATLEKRPGRGYGAGVAAFDLRSRGFTWHRDGACPVNAVVAGVAVAGDVVVCGGARQSPSGGQLVALNRRDGVPLWSLDVPTVDAVSGAGDVIVVSYGSRAAVVDAAAGEVLYELESDNRHLPRVVPVELTDDRGQPRTLVIAVEQGGNIVARDPGLGGVVVWALATRGYIVALRRADAELAVTFTSGEVRLLSPADGADRVIGSWSSRWQLVGDLLMADATGPLGSAFWRAFDASGSERFLSAYGLPAPLGVAALRGDEAGAPLLGLTYRGVPRLLHIEPRRGALVALYRLPPRHVRGGVFSAFVDGKPVIGAVLQKPAAVHFF